MRSSRLSFVVVGLSGALALAYVACTPPPAVTVIRLAPGESPDLTGDSVKLRRGSQATYAGVRSGIHVVRSVEDWQNAWHEGKSPPLPPTLDLTNDMLVLVVPEDRELSLVKVQRGAETAGLVSLWIRETKRGEGCVKKEDERPAVDAVITTRTDKPIRFYVDQDRAASCGAPPTAGVVCRAAGEQSWSPKLVARPGDKIECELSTAARGKYELVDKQMILGEAPPGSAARLSFAKERDRVSFPVDFFGTYVVRGEARDEAGRRGSSTATIDVVPKRTRDVLIQLMWPNLDPSIDTDTLPRTTLRAAQEGPRGQRCSTDIPVPGLCDAKTSGATTYMRIPAQSRRLAMSVLYLDAKPETAPAPCLHVWFDGKRTSELCDRRGRGAEDRWELGVLDTATGKITEPPPPAAPPISDAGADVDGGAPPPAK